MRIIFNLRDDRLPDTIGSKAANLRWLIKAGYLVPESYVCSWVAYDLYQQNTIDIIDILDKELTHVIKPDCLYAVRSSANLEDRYDYSFAGQFKSSLNVQGVTQIMQAIWSIWSSAQSSSIQPYLKKDKNSQESLKMAVVIQEMVRSQVAGVIFSKNPTNGADEVVIEAVEGLGSALVQDGVIPTRWIIKQGQWIITPKQPILPDSIINDLCNTALKITKNIKKPVDLEWVFDGKEVNWVQLRLITRLNQVNVYSNVISREQLPGQIKPLVWSINIPVVTGAWIRLLTEIIGSNDLTPDQLVKAFYYRAYYNMGVFAKIFERLGLPSKTLEMMMGMDKTAKEKPAMKMNVKLIPLIPRITWFILKKFSLLSELNKNLPLLESMVASHVQIQKETLGFEEILQRLDALSSLVGRLAYYNIIVPLTASLSCRILEYQVRKRGKEPGLLKMDEVEQSPYHNLIGRAICELHQRFMEIPIELRDKIESGSIEKLWGMEGIESFISEFKLFLLQYGYLTESTTNFSTPSWKENPEVVLKMIIDYKIPTHNIEEFGIEQVDFPIAYQWMMKKLYKETVQFKIFRERVGDLFTRGYALFKDYFLVIGNQLTQRGWINTPEDIYFLYRDEVVEIVRHPEYGSDLARKIETRKMEMEACKSYPLPEVFYGENPPVVVAQVSSRLTGVPTSAGYYTGRVKVIKTIRDFEKLKQGDILVVPYTDVSWTSLFAKVGGVIAESGGLLSHSSIIAREYQIPAIVSVTGATMLADDTMVTMDGYRGEISIHVD